MHALLPTGDRRLDFRQATRRPPTVSCTAMVTARPRRAEAHARVITAPKIVVAQIESTYASRPTSRFVVGQCPVRVHHESSTAREARGHATSTSLRAVTPLFPHGRIERVAMSLLSPTTTTYAPDAHMKESVLTYARASKQSDACEVNAHESEPCRCVRAIACQKQNLTLFGAGPHSAGRLASREVRAHAYPG